MSVKGNYVKRIATLVALAVAGVGLISAIPASAGTCNPPKICVSPIETGTPRPRLVVEQADTRIVGLGGTAQFNATPEPLAVGDVLSLKGRLERQSGSWGLFANQPLVVERRLTGGTYKPFKNVTSDVNGDVNTTVSATATASWRLVFKGNATNKASTSKSDNVIVGQKNVTKTTLVTQWPDSAVGGGNWAHDAFARKLVITRGAAVTGGWKYSFTLTDVGTFKSGLDAPAPNGGGNLHGIIRGSFNGGLKGSFVANTRVLDAANVPANEDGEVDGQISSSSQWGKLALPTGISFTDLTTDDWGWTYKATAPDTCETFSQINSVYTGNLTGVNACTS